MELMLNHIAGLFNPPQPLPGAEAGEQFLFCTGETERLAGGSDLIRFLSIDDPGLCVGKEAVGEGAHGGSLVTNVVKVGELMENQEVRDAVVAGKPPMLTTYLLRRDTEPCEMLARFIERVAFIDSADSLDAAEEA